MLYFDVFEAATKIVELCEKAFFLRTLPDTNQICGILSDCFNEQQSQIKELKQLLQEVLETHEIQTGDMRPWKGNDIMDGCIKGTWLKTPEKIKAALEKNAEK